MSTKNCLRSLFIVLFLCTALFAEAQTNYLIDGPQEVCPEDCHTYSVFPADSNIVSTLWIITGEGVTGLTYEVDGAHFDLCWNGSVPLDPGNTFHMVVEVFLANGEVYTAEMTVHIVESALISATPVAGVCQGDSLQQSYQVCESVPSIFSLEPPPGPNPILSGNGSNAFYEVNGNLLTVEWGEPGFASVNLVFSNANDSFYYCNQYLNITAEVLADPEAGFTTNPPNVDGVVQVCEGQTVYFENTSTNAEHFEWILGGETSHQVNVEQTYSSPGTYEVTLIAYSNCLCSDTTSVTVEVENAESPVVDCVGTICENTTVTYSSDVDCGTFLWNISSNGTISDGGGTSDNFITIDWGNGPAGTIELTVDNCPDIDYCLDPTFVQVPILSDDAAIAGPTKVCRADVVNYTLPNYEGTEFIWSVSSLGTILSGQGTNEIQVEWANQFSMTPQTVSVDYSNCYLECGGSDELVINILPELFVLGPIEVCENGTTQPRSASTLNNNLTPANWQVLDNTGATVWSSAGATSMPSIDWTFGPGVFTLAASSSTPDDFCTETFELPITVVAAPPVVDAIEGETNICPGETYAYQAASSQPNNNFIWEINDGGIISARLGNPINISWGSTPPYELSVIQVSTAGLPCESDPFVQTIQAVPLLSIQGEIDVCQDQTSTYSTDDVDQVDYSWSILPVGAGTITGEVNSSTIEILWHASGAATVQLEVCGQTDNFAVNILPRPEPVVNHPADLCPNEVASLNTTANFDSYTWKDENGSVISTQQTPDLGPGYYQLVVEDEFGCIGNTTFHINGREASEISISTPDFTRFCNAAPSATLYAVNAFNGYDYQWYHDGNPVGLNDPILVATAFGSYYVEITDFNGCMVVSNTIGLVEDCGGGGPSGATCADISLDFDIQGTTACNVRNYTNQATNMIPGSASWYFDDPQSGADNFSSLDNPSHAYSKAGFFKVQLIGDFDDPANPGNTITCGIVQVDTVVLAANFEFDNACPGLPVQFSDLSTFLPVTNIADWAWDFGDPGSGADNTSTNPNPVHTYASEGSYTVTLTVTATTGCTATITKNLDVYPPPAVSFTPPASNCEGTALHFVADVPANVTNVAWNFGDPASGQANSSELFDTYHAFAQPGTYTVTLFAQSIYGCTNSFSQTITIEPNTLSGDISLSVPSPICEGDSTILTPPANGVAWFWSDGSSGNSLTVTEAGVYEVTVVDAQGCSYAPAPVVIDVIPAPEAPIRAVEYNEYGQAVSYFENGYETCEGEDIFLETFQNASYTFTWSNGDPGPNTEYSETRGNLLSAGNYDIFLTVTDNTTGCANEMGPFAITVHPVPVNVQISVDQAGIICESTEATFSVDSPDPALTYIWNTGAIGTTLTTSMAGEYYVTAISEFGCTAESNRLEIVDGPDIARIPSGCHTRCRPDTICLPTIPGIVSYQWVFNGTPIAPPDGTMPELIITESGDYWLEMADVQGCSLTSGTLTLDLFDGYGDFNGNVYFDVNENNIIDAADTVVSGIDLRLLDTDMVEVGTATSDVDGAYVFSNVLSTEYIMEIDTNSLPEDYGVLIPQVQTELIGCDVEETINWLLILDCPEVENTLNLTICEGESVIYNGTNYESDTTFVASYTTATGCDSNENVTIQVLPSDATVLSLQVCEGESVEYEGVNLEVGDQQDFTFVNQNGCDSTVAVSIVGLPNETVDIDLFVCEGETLEYNGLTLGANMQQSFQFVNQNGCDSMVNVTVSAFTEMDFAVQPEKSCPNEASGTALVEDLTGGTPPYQYSLDGITYQNEPLFEDLNAGIYSLIIQDANGCEQQADFAIESIEVLSIVVEDAVLDCQLLTAELQVDVLGGDTTGITYLWEDGTIGAKRTVTEPGTYQLQVANQCEVIETNVQVKRDDNGLSDLIYLPNVFSPNADGINDDFRGYIGSGVTFESYELHIFDRWGNELFLTEDFSQGWDGRFKGKLMPSGVYVWRLKTNVVNCGQLVEVVRTGDMALLR